MSHSVACPCCQDELYTTVALSKDHSAKHSGPDMQREGERMYMVCPHCHKKIDFLGGNGLRISPIQKCGK